MSQRRERVEQVLGNVGFDLDDLIAYYHLPVLALLLVFMFWVRIQSWENFTRSGRVMFSGNDAWYHLRATSWTVRNWPFVIPFDPWTGFPTGNFNGQFGTLFDQLVATAALIVGLGSPSQQTIAMTLLFAPAVVGTLAAIPVYVMARRLRGRTAGLLAVVVLALTPGSFLRRSVVGFSDHHIAEALFLAIAVALVMVAVTAAERDRPIWELVANREWTALRRPGVWSVLAGVAITLYLWTWPPGVFLVAILGTFYLLKLLADYLRGESPDHVAFVAVVSMSVVTVLTLLTIDVLSIRATALSLLQPLLAAMVAAGAAFMALLARQWDDRDLDPLGYPTVVAVLLVVGTGLVAVVFPEFFDFIVRQAGRIVGYDATAEARTVGEAQPIPLERADQVFFQNYRFAAFIAVIGLVWGVWKLYAAGPRGELLLVVVLGLFMTAATFTQRRFDYYLAIPVAVLTGFALSSALSLAELEDIEVIRDVEAYQVLAVLTVLVLVVGPFVSFPQGGGGAFGGATLASVSMAGNTGPGEVRQWEDSLVWLTNETPAEGQYAAAEEEQMAYFGRFGRTDDHDYAPGAYGVIAWWDYGHFITVIGNRIPFANPFQQHARGAAVYLLEPNETNANGMLASDEGEQTRFVMIDWKLAQPFSGKYAAPTAFYNNTGYGSDAPETIAISDLYTNVFSTRTGRLAFPLKHQRHYESMRVRLYQYHGSAMEPQPIVTDYDIRAFDQGEVAVTPSDGNTTRQFRSMRQARQFVEEDGSAQVGGIGPFPPERVPALQHYRLVKVAETSGLRAARFQRVLIQDMQGHGLCQTRQQCLGIGQQLQATPQQWVKTFERVPGGTVEGTGPANATVTAEVEMRMTTVNRTFTYTQQAQTGPEGQFTMTLPYASSDYEAVGVPEGYTNTSVRATGPYEFSTPPSTNESDYVTRWSATADVSEAQVLGVDETPVSVQLESGVLLPPQDGDGNGSA